MTLALSLLALLATAAPTQDHPAGAVVVANRGSGSISVIDVRTDAVSTIPLPAGAFTPEPMYVERAGAWVLVGDRANDRVVAYGARDLSLAATVPTGQGVFHMKADPTGRRLWVANDIDDTFTVIDVRSLEVVGDFPLPADLVAAGGKPHDVVLGMEFGYLSMVGVAGADDYIVQFSRQTFTETARAAVGKDPHLALSLANPVVQVPAQDADAVYALRRSDLELVDQIAVHGAHGAALGPGGRIFYTTDLTGGGPGGLVTIDARNLVVLGTTDTPHPVPHNIAVTRGGRKLYVTHSGAVSDRVSIFTATQEEPVPAPIGEVSVGLNPFGIAFVD